MKPKNNVINYIDYIKTINNFPTTGVSFKDISPLLESNLWPEIITRMGMLVTAPKYWVGIDARGFLFASSLAYKFGGGILMCRKTGKLPPPYISYSYQNEYQSNSISVHPGSGTVIIVDDVLATGGTFVAANKLLKSAGYTIIDNLVLIDLTYIKRKIDLEIKSLIKLEK